MQHLKTLVVEDSKLDARIVQGLMDKSTIFDFDIVTVACGNEAKKNIDLNAPDLVLLDLGLPETTGAATLDTFASYFVDVPVIILTGEDSIDLATAALRKGAQEYLVKGQINLSNLEKSVTYALERHRLCQEKAASELQMNEAIARTNRMLEALDKTNAKLEDEIAKSRLLTTAIEQSVETVLITDTQGTILYANHSFETVTGYSIDEAIGKNPRMLKSGLHDRQFYQHLWESLKSVGTWTGRMKNRKKDGTIYEEDARISSVTDAEGNVTNYVAVKKDVTHEAALELQLMQAHKLESIGQLAAGIAHEINTPSQYVGDNIRFLKEAVEGFMTVLEKYGEISKELCPEFKGGELYQALETIKEELDLEFLLDEAPAAIAQSLDGIGRISKIVQAMKDFSHPGTEQMTVSDINKAINSTITVASNEWKYVATLETELQEGLPMVPCFVGELNQVFLNMIVNAAHAIEEAKRENGVITIRTVLAEPYIKIEISDNGSGIPLNIRKKIFDPFFTTKEVGKGTGQGLAMAFSTVTERHHGQLLVDSKVGVGTTFSILLPLKQVAEVIQEENDA